MERSVDKLSINSNLILYVPSVIFLIANGTGPLPNDRPLPWAVTVLFDGSKEKGQLVSGKVSVSLPLPLPILVTALKENKMK